MQDPSHVRFIFVTHYTLETDDPFRPFRLNARGDFENPSLKAIADIFIGIMIAHGCDPDATKNLVYSSVAGVDLLPVMVPHDWSSKKAAYAWMAPVCLVWVPPRHRRWLGPKPPATMLSSASRRSTVQFYVRQRKKKTCQDPGKTRTFSVFRTECFDFPIYF